MIHTGHGRRRAGHGNPRGVSRLPTSMSKDAARYVHFNLDDVPESGNVLTDVSSMAVGFTRERERGGEGGDHGASPPRRAGPACSSWPAGRHLPYHCGCFRYTVRSGDARARRERALKVGQASGASFSPRLDPLAVRVSKTLIRQTFCELGASLISVGALKNASQTDLALLTSAILSTSRACLLGALRILLRACGNLGDCWERNKLLAAVRH